MKNLFLLSVLFYPLAFVYAQREDDNIVITNKEESYTFFIDKNTVCIKEKASTDYLCTKMNASIPVIEMYDIHSTIDKISVKADNKPKPRYSLYISDDIFYSDAKICYFDLHFSKKDRTAAVQLEKTYRDPRYFSTIYFSEPLFVQQKTVTIRIPDWMNAELVEKNMGDNIQKDVAVDEKKHARIYTYRVKDEAAMKTEKNMPGKSYIYPHVLVLSKSATVNNAKVSYFEKLSDQYNWYRAIVEQVNNDQAIIRAQAEEITKNSRTPLEKIQAIYAWVQENIRYIAFEDGIAGFKPDNAQEVLRKKYGDCKGMANLVKSLLEAEGFDARLSWIGTNHIAYDYSTPSLVVDNHMICTLFYDEQTYYLDPTVKYMALGEYPQTIQGRQVMIADGDRFILNRIPVFPPAFNIDSLHCEYSIDDNRMIGKAVRTCKGESKQLILNLLNQTRKDKLDTALKEFLAGGRLQNEVYDVEMTGNHSQATAATIRYSIKNQTGIQSYGNELYIELDNDPASAGREIDALKRTNDIQFPYRYHDLATIVLNIPSGYKVSSLPQSLEIVRDGYRMSIQYEQSKEKILYRKEITISSLVLKKSDFNTWNSDMKALKKALLQQITLIK
ncbi:MAG: transglutaminase-like domain-containing protein [Dysgonamonadaceae bacterium]|jgi:transglutaminase-like putative cysteine protease|nr:transglutaminase-like domain-containing protein [Dysgonamonadaceae bacterium]